ncbi:MAG: HAMP domain-containing sensor histidine kinase [bacterium]|nr:HAMP domain-containing sensor histidine kinase [bacterium]
MDLSTFIRSNEEPIIREWEEFAKTLLPAPANLDRDRRRDHIRALLTFIADDLGSSQTHIEQADKSKGRGPEANGYIDSAAQVHADVRFMDGLDIIQMVSEFRALRASVIKLWNKEHKGTTEGFDDATRFHEAIDQIVMESLVRYNNNINRARNLFLGALVHDMRTPLAAVSNSAQILTLSKNLDDRQMRIAAQIERSTASVIQLVTHLIDATHVQLGKGVPVTPAQMDLAEAVSDAVRQAQAAHPGRSITLDIKGELTGKWDSSRMNQVISNLIGNGIKHGSATSVISVVAKGDRERVTLSVHNEGDPIPSESQNMIFQPLIRGSGDRQAESVSTSLGLGLFICKEIINGHGGEISVTSTAKEGTTFIVSLPRGGDGPANENLKA